MTNRLVFWLSALLIGSFTLPLLAHHGLAAQYDVGKTETIQGIITKMEWVNPHVWITLEVKNANGSIVSWHVEIRAPNALVRDGMRKEFFELDKPCSMEVWLARDGSKTASGRTLKFVDGKSFDVSDTFGQIMTITPGK